MTQVEGVLNLASLREELSGGLASSNMPLIANIARQKLVDSQAEVYPGDVTDRILLDLFSDKITVAEAFQNVVMKMDNEEKEGKEIQGREVKLAVNCLKGLSAFPVTSTIHLRILDHEASKLISAYLDQDLHQSNFRGKRYVYLMLYQPRYLLSLLFEAVAISQRQSLHQAAVIWLRVAQDRDMERVARYWRAEMVTIHLAGDYRTPFLLAGDIGSVALFRFLMKRAGFDFERDKQCIHLAAKSGNLDFAKAVLLNTPEISGLLINAQDHNGSTPLHHAVQENQVPMVHFLIESGARYNVLDNSLQPPLSYCQDNEALTDLFQKIATAFDAANEKNYDFFGRNDFESREGKLVWNARAVGTNDTPLDILFE